jgi:transposase
MHSLDYRLAALRIYDFLGSMRQASKAVGVGVASISRWSRALNPRGWPSRESKIIPAVEAAIVLVLRDAPNTSASDLTVYIKTRFNICVSRQLVALVLKKKLGYTWKRTRKRGPRGAGWTDDRLEEFKRQFVSAYASGRLSAWDESSFDQRCRPVYGYAPAGKQAILNVPKSKCNHLHHSLLMAIHMDGSRHHMLRTGSVKAEHFADFIDQAP